MYLQAEVGCRGINFENKNIREPQLKLQFLTSIVIEDLKAHYIN